MERCCHVHIPLSWQERLILFTEVCLTASQPVPLKLYPKGQPRTKHTETRLARLLHIKLQVLTAAINNSWNGWQWNLLELWGHDGNRRLIHPRLCNNNRAVTMTSTGRSRQKALAKELCKTTLPLCAWSIKQNKYCTASSQPYLTPQPCSQQVQERNPKCGIAVPHSSETATDQTDCR